MNEKISRKEALKRIALFGGAFAAVAALSTVSTSCVVAPTATPTYSKYCNIGCESFYSSETYCNYSNWIGYCNYYSYGYYSCYATYYC